MKNIPNYLRLVQENVDEMISREGEGTLTSDVIRQKCIAAITLLQQVVKVNSAEDARSLRRLARDRAGVRRAVPA